MKRDEYKGNRLIDSRYTQSKYFPYPHLQNQINYYMAHE